MEGKKKEKYRRQMQKAQSQNQMIKLVLMSLLDLFLSKNEKSKKIVINKILIA